LRAAIKQAAGAAADRIDRDQDARERRHCSGSREAGVADLEQPQRKHQQERHGINGEQARIGQRPEQATLDAGLVTPVFERRREGEDRHCERDQQQGGGERNARRCDGQQHGDEHRAQRESELDQNRIESESGLALGGIVEAVAPHGARQDGDRRCEGARDRGGGHESCGRQGQPVRQQYEDQRHRADDAGNEHHGARSAAVDDASQHGGGDRRRREIDADGQTSERERSGQRTQVHQHRQRQTRYRQPCDQRGREQPCDVRQAQKRPVATEDVVEHRVASPRTPPLAREVA